MEVTLPGKASPLGHSRSHAALLPMPIPRFVAQESAGSASRTWSSLDNPEQDVLDLKIRGPHDADPRTSDAFVLATTVASSARADAHFTVHQLPPRRLMNAFETQRTKEPA